MFASPIDTLLQLSSELKTPVASLNLRPRHPPAALWWTLSNKHYGSGRATRDLRRGQSQNESYFVWQRVCLRVFLGPRCTSVSLRGHCNIFKTIANPVLFVSPIRCLRDTAGVAKPRQLLLLALGPLRPKEITSVFTLQGVHHLRANIKMLDAC